MLKLTYARKRDRRDYVTVIGDPYGIRDLYIQLTKNYKCDDGSCIGAIKVTNLDGEDVTDRILIEPHYASTKLSNIG